MKHVQEIEKLQNTDLACIHKMIKQIVTQKTCLSEGCINPRRK